MEFLFHTIVLSNNKKKVEKPTSPVILKDITSKSCVTATQTHLVELNRILMIVLI